MRPHRGSSHSKAASPTGRTVGSWQERLDGLPVYEREGLQVHTADSGAARLRGLAGLDHLPPGLGLELPGTRSIHTLGMRFALDLTWLDSTGSVVRVDRNVPPRRVRTCLRARSVIEARAGYTRGVDSNESL